jgi:hypothetical protein
VVWKYTSGKSAKAGTKSLSKSQPKVKLLMPRLKAREPAAIAHSCAAEVGGKAGRTFFPIFVGQNEYLYKSPKTARRVQVQQDTIDLHGCTRDEALQRLNSALPI